MTPSKNSFELSNFKNNFVMAPMTRCISLKDGKPSVKLINNYIKQAENGIGLIIVESSAINDLEANGYLNGSKFFNIDHALAWKPTVKRIHQLGSKIILQLFHAGRLTVKEITGRTPIAPSAIYPSEGKSFWRPEINNNIVHFQTHTKFEKPREISLMEIKQIFNEFETACKLALDAGFDGVELHGAHGYLLHTFCNSLTNIRDDEYGYSDDFKFVCDLVKRCKKILGKKLLSYRLSLHMVDNSYIKHDNDVTNFDRLVQALDNAGVNIFHCSELYAGNNMFGSKQSLLSIIRNNTMKPIIACGGIRSSEHIKKLLSNGANMIAFGRPILSNLDLLNKIQSNIELDEFDYKIHFEK